MASPSLPESFYSPWRIRQELRQLAVTSGEILPQHRIHSEEKRNPSGRWSMETAVCIKADLIMALEALRATSEVHYQVVFGLNVPRPNQTAGDKPPTITSLARELGYDWETIRRADIDGIAWIAHYLGWDGNWDGWFRRRRIEGPG